MSKLSVSGLSMTRGGRAVLDDISFAVEDGSFCVIIGPSGCGKTTLLRLMAGLERAASGTILLDGEDVTALPPQRRGVGMVFQGFALYPHMTVQGNLTYGLQIAGAPKAEIAQRLAETCALLQLTEFLARAPDQLSGGQQQRVAIGRAIMRKPKLLLFDEPLSNLDARLRGEMRIELRRVHRETGATSLFVTHDQTEAMTMADKIIMLHEGRIEQIGSPREVYDDPKTLFAAGFLGHPPINVLEAEVNSGILRLNNGPAIARTAARSGPVIFAIRPEDVRLRGSHPATVTAVEDYGAAAVIHLSLAGRPLSALAGAERPAPARQLHLGFCLTAAMLFDPITGERVLGRLDTLDRSAG